MLAEDISKRLQETFASNEKVREGLTDTEAMTLLDWGIAYADALAARLAANPQTSQMTEEQIGEIGYALTRLMTRMNWLVTYRTRKDAAWLVQTFQQVNKFSQELLGDHAPVISSEQIQGWLDYEIQRTNDALIRNLIAQLSPPEMGTSAPPAAGQPAAGHPVVGAPPASPPGSPPGQPAAGHPVVGAPSSGPSEQPPPQTPSSLPGRSPDAPETSEDEPPKPASKSLGALADKLLGDLLPGRKPDESNDHSPETGEEHE